MDAVSNLEADELMDINTKSDFLNLRIRREAAKIIYETLNK